MGRAVLTVKSWTQSTVSLVHRVRRVIQRSSFHVVCNYFSFYSLGDVPMGRVKMTAKHEYEYVANFKVLQNIFKAHKIDKVCQRALT